LSLLSELLKEIGDDPVVTQVKKICDKIFDEEKEGMKNLEEAPKGGNTFLSLQVEYRINEISFLSLEREAPQTFIAVLYSRKVKSLEKHLVLKRIKVWDINQYVPKRIIKEYACLLKYVNVEI